MILDGKALAAKIRGEVKEEVSRLAQRGVQPGFAVILAGDDPASRVYVRNKVRACKETAVRSFFLEYPASVSESELVDRVGSLNADPAVHGILVQLPLPNTSTPSGCSRPFHRRRTSTASTCRTSGRCSPGAPGSCRARPRG